MKLIDEIKNQFINQSEAFKTISYLQVHLTSRCEESCEHCYLKDKYRNLDIKYTEISNFINQFVKISQKNNRKLYISFTGGDPLLYPKFESIISEYSAKGINVSIKGNPTLINGNLVKNLKKLNIAKYHLSLDGLENIHDSIRSNGRFKTTLNAIDTLHQENIPVLIKYTLSKKNYVDIFNSMKLMSEKGVEYFDFARLAPLDQSSEFYISPTEYKNLLSNILSYYIQLLKTGSKMRLLFRDHLWNLLFYEMGIINDIHTISGCSMLNPYCFVINYDANVYKCAKVRNILLGNIYRDSLHDILINQEDSGVLKREYYEGCKSCKLFLICRGCCATCNAVNMRDSQCWREI